LFSLAALKLKYGFDTTIKSTKKARIFLFKNSGNGNFRLKNRFINVSKKPCQWLLSWSIKWMIPHPISFCRQMAELKKAISK